MYIYLGKNCRVSFETAPITLGYKKPCPTANTKRSRLCLHRVPHLKVADLNTLRHGAVLVSFYLIFLASRPFVLSLDPFLLSRTLLSCLDLFFAWHACFPSLSRRLPCLAALPRPDPGVHPPAVQLLEGAVRCAILVFRRGT